MGFGIYVALVADLVEFIFFSYSQGVVAVSEVDVIAGDGLLMNQVTKEAPKKIQKSARAISSRCALI